MRNTHYVSITVNNANHVIQGNIYTAQKNVKTRVKRSPETPAEMLTEVQHASRPQTASMKL